MPCLFSYLPSLRCSPRRQSATIGLVLSTSPCLRLSTSFTQALTFPSFALSPPPTSSSSFISSPLISSSFFFPSSPALLPLGPVCIPARRGRGVCDPSFDKDQAHSPSVSSPPPWENGCVLLPGRASDSPRGARCQPRQPRLNMICSSAAAAACLHPSLAPALVPPAAEPERR